MKKLLLLVLIAGILLMTSCTHKETFQSGNEQIIAEPYGLANENSLKVDTVVYEISMGNVVWSMLLCQTIIVPVYFVGWDIYQPIRLKNEKDLKKKY